MRHQAPTALGTAARKAWHTAQTHNPFGCWHSHLVWRDDSCSQDISQVCALEHSIPVFCRDAFPSTLNEDQAPPRLTPAPPPRAKPNSYRDFLIQ